MIVLILFLTTLGAVSAQQGQPPDYYALDTDTYGYKVFTRRLDCSDPVYESGDKQVLFKIAQKWIIGKLTKDENLECQNIGNTVDKYFESTENTPTDGSHWINIKESRDHNILHAYVGLRSLNKCKEIQGLRVSTATFSLISMEDCISKDYWAKNYPAQTVFVSIKEDSKCSFDSTKDVKLFNDNKAKLFIHSSCRRVENGEIDQQQSN